MNAYFAAHALLPEGWARNVRFTIDASGDFTSVTPDSTPGGAMPLPGFVVPGMPNVHSHAFQRSIAGSTERAGGPGDSFWTWREAMYAAVATIDPDAFEAVAADAYVAMLEAGYTNVCEFHYVHRAPNGAAYARRAELSDRIVAAARAAGIGLTLLPVLYRYADFGAAPPGPRQARFVLTFDEYAALWQTLNVTYADDPQITLGAAPHSLRAVGRDDLRELERLARADVRATGAAAPLHVHVSEQEREVEACRVAFGTTPVALLADTVALDERWCLVHATHATEDELATIAAAGAVVGLCPTTEANLGDGIFATAAFAARGGRFAVGSDSNVTIDVAEELRWVEYAQRLALRRRNVLQDAATPSVGRYLYDAALRGGAQASGRRIGALAPGYRADAVALELPPNAKADGDELLDTAIFRSGAWRVRDVIAGGRLVVRDGRHELRGGRRPCRRGRSGPVNTRTIELDGRRLRLEAIEAIARDGAHVTVANDARERVAAARACVERQFQSGAIIYGVTTGFGRMANVVIDRADVDVLQQNLVRSHAAGTGEPLAEAFVRAAGVLRASSLAAGHSGIRVETLDLLVEILNRGVTPVVPAQGSVGASGDLAPLAHMTLTLIGEGEAFYGGRRMRSADALAEAGLAPIRLGAKEGLSLINGTEVMTGIAVLSLLRAERLLATADVIGALSIEAFLATDNVFDRRINALRPHPGQARVADRLRALVSGSQVMQSHRDCGRVQDPYSFRCIPVVHGAARDAAEHVRRVLEIEAISVTDNPLIFPEEDEFLTGGNFHGQPVGVVCDFLKAVMVEVASISERRSYLLLNGEERGLPLFLSRKPGLESGLMIAQYCAAALVSESKALAMPSSVDSIPTSAGQEDHVSMGTIAARTLDKILDNAEGALACELLCALAATDFRRPLRGGAGTQAAYDVARERIAPLVADRVQATDIELARELIRSNALTVAAERHARLEEGVRSA